MPFVPVNNSRESRRVMQIDAVTGSPIGAGELVSYREFRFGREYVRVLNNDTDAVANLQILHDLGFEKIHYDINMLSLKLYGGLNLSIDACVQLDQNNFKMMMVDKFDHLKNDLERFINELKDKI